MQFQATVRLDGKTATGIRVPDEIVTALGGGNRSGMRVRLADYSYRTTVARMRGGFLFPVSAVVRQSPRVGAGDEVDVQIELDDAPPELPVPEDLAELLELDRRAREVFEMLSYSNRGRHVLAIEGAKTSETRERRLATLLDELRAQA